MKLLRRDRKLRSVAAGGGQPVLAMLAFFVLLVLTLAGPVMTMETDGVVGQGQLNRQIGYLAVAAMAFLSVRPFRHPERLLTVSWPLVLALAWCWVSLAWSLYPEIAVRRLVLTSIILWSVFVLVRQLGAERTLTLVRIALVAALAANFAAVLIDPVFAIHGADEDLTGSWRGVMMHKNIAGLVCALTVIFFGFDRQKWPLAAQIGVIGAAILFLVLTSSKTAMAACVVAMPLGYLAMRYLPQMQAGADRIARVRGAGWVAILVPLALLLVLVFAFEDSVLAVLADPAAFTGRTQIWQALSLSFLERPVLGVGYGSFWNVGPTGPIYRHANFAWVDGVSQGHNGYLDLLVTIGLPGLLLVLFATVAWPLRRLLRTREVAPATAGLAVATILFCVIHNGSESTLFDRDTIGQVFLVVVLAMVHASRSMIAPATPAVRGVARGPVREKRPLRL